MAPGRRKKDLAKSEKIEVVNSNFGIFCAINFRKTFKGVKNLKIMAGPVKKEWPIFLVFKGQGRFEVSIDG